MISIYRFRITIQYTKFNYSLKKFVRKKGLLEVRIIIMEIPTFIVRNQLPPQILKLIFLCTYISCNNVLLLFLKIKVMFSMCEIEL